MEFVDYTYYHDTFGGSEPDDAKFKNALKWATAEVNKLTFGRIQRLDQIPDCVKDAICAAIQKYIAYKEQSELTKTSESNDGYSVSYATPVTEEVFSSEVRRTVKKFLSGTGLTYLGTSRIYDLQEGGNGSG